MAGQQETFLAKLCEMGEENVRQALDEGRFGSTNAMWAQAWLNRSERERVADAIASQKETNRRQLDLAEEANHIALEANGIAETARDKARTANQFAACAIAFAAVAIVIDIIQLF